MNSHKIPVSILYKSIAGCYLSIRAADGSITTHYRFIKNASWDIFSCKNNNLLFFYHTIIALSEITTRYLTALDKRIDHTFTTKYVHFAYVIMIWLSSTYHYCRAHTLYQAKISQNCLGPKTNITTFRAVSSLAFDCSVLFYKTQFAQLVISHHLVTSTSSVFTV